MAIAIPLLWTIVWTQLIYKDLLPALAAGAWQFFTVNIVFSGVQECCAFWSAKVPKALCQSSKGPATTPHTSKKQRHFVLYSYSFKLRTCINEHKTTAFKVW